MNAGSYVLDLTCRNMDVQPGEQGARCAARRSEDFHHTTPHLASVQTREQAEAMATREQGWRFDPDGDVTCPRCVERETEPLPF